MASGGEQAFRSLIETVTKDDSQTNLTPEAITRLTEKLSEIVGYDALNDFTGTSGLVNEEGLPIIDITEPLQDSQSGAPSLALPEPVVPLAQIPVSARQRLREQRDRILDTLEQEERQEEDRIKRQEREEYEETARKRNKLPVSEKERVNTAKELQKRMGKALLRNMAESKEQAVKEREEQRIRDEQEDAKRENGSPSKKKNVTFADAPAMLSPEKDTQDWGDVSQGRILPMKRPSLLSEKSGSHTMKMNVVERYRPRAAPPPKAAAAEKDSDDESEEDETHHSPPRSPALSEDELHSDQELEEEIDFDFASLQRQVQLEYHRKRDVIGHEAAALIQSPLEPQVAQNTDDGLGISKGDSTKPAMSQYRASRLVSAYGAANPSAGSSFIVPAASAQTLRTAIRTGKLNDDGNLIGGEEDSASENEDNGMHEVLELLKKGEVYNVGPNGEPIVVFPKDMPSTSTSVPTPTSSALRLDEAKILPPLATKPAMSKFKLSRLAASQTPESAPETHSESATPVNNLGRSSPKGATPSPSPSVLTPTLIIDSPSFAPLPGARSGSVNPSQPFSMVVESPSFPQPGVPRHQQPSSARTVSSLPTQAQVVERRSNRPDRPPMIMSSTVRETKPTALGDESEQPPKDPPKKVSKFKRDRMQ